MKPVHVVVLSPEHTNASWRWVASHFDALEWSFFSPEPSSKALLPWQRLLATFKAVIKARQTDVLVSHGPYMAFYAALLLWLLRMRTPHVVYSFNFAELPFGLTLLRMQFAFKKIDKLVVSSRMEIELYANHFKIPPEKFDFVRWGVNKPDFQDSPPKLDGNYICAVGGNARDYPLFMAAMKALPDIPAIVVVRPHNLVGLEIPNNVTVLTNIPKDEAYSVIAHSRFMALPLKGDEIPCGHVTIVVAFYLGIPTIATDSSGINDYIIDNETGLLCLPGSAESMKSAIIKLWNNQAIRAKIGPKGKAFAEANCSEQNYVTHFKDYLASVAKHHE